MLPKARRLLPTAYIQSGSFPRGPSLCPVARPGRDKRVRRGSHRYPDHERSLLREQVTMSDQRPFGEDASESPSHSADTVGHSSTPSPAAESTTEVVRPREAEVSTPAAQTQGAPAVPPAPAEPAAPAAPIAAPAAVPPAPAAVPPAPAAVPPTPRAPVPAAPAPEKSTSWLPPPPAGPIKFLRVQFVP